MEIKDIVKIINQNKKIALSSHVNPDGDALGSTFALAKALEMKGKDVQIFLEDKVPKIYDKFFKESLVKHELPEDQNFDLFISLDISTNDRLGKFEILNEKILKTINVDHHISNKGIAKYNVVVPKASATAEIVYELIKALQIKITDEIAKYLYIGILTDTGGFKYNNTTSKTMLIISELIKYDLNCAYIYKEVFDTISYKKLAILKLALENIEIFCKGKIAIMIIKADDFEKTGTTYEECDGIVNYARNVEGVEVGVLIAEKGDNLIKVSMRANDYLNVAEISTMFDGGGHEKAAGFLIKLGDTYKNTEDIKNKIIQIVSEKI